MYFSPSNTNISFCLKIAAKKKTKQEKKLLSKDEQFRRLVVLGATFHLICNKLSFSSSRHKERKTQRRALKTADAHHSQARLLLWVNPFCLQLFAPTVQRCGAVSRRQRWSTGQTAAFAHLDIQPETSSITYSEAAPEYRAEEFSAGDTDLLKNMTCDKNQCANLKPSSSIRGIKKEIT